MEQNLSDNQRRTICRVLFLLLCALPTLVTVYFATHQRTPHQWAQLLHAELGVEPRIGVVETPRPGEMIFHDVKLYDVAGEMIFESLTAKATLGNINQIEFQGPIQVTQKGLSDFLKEASARLVKPRANFKPWTVRFQDVHITDGPDPSFQNKPLHLQNVLVGTHFGDNGIYLTASANELGWIDFSRAPNKSRYAGQFETRINVNETPVPCWLAAGWFPQLKQLGKQAHFKGFAGVHSRGGLTMSSLAGDFFGVDLPSVSGFRPGSVELAQSLSVRALEFEDSKWLSGDATLVVDGYRPIHLNPKFFGSAEPTAASIDQIVRQAFREVSNTGVPPLSINR